VFWSECSLVSPADLVWELSDAEFKRLKMDRAAVKVECFNLVSGVSGGANQLKKMGYVVTPLKVPLAVVLFVSHNGTVAES
jgi:hypothetical protein